MNELVTNLAEATCCTRREQLNGREHLVVPTVMLVPGVLNGEYVSAEEVAASVAAWNDVPIPIEHPRERGLPISARQPEVLERAVVGRLYGANVGPTGNLRGEMWLDIAKVGALGYADMLELLEAGGPVEVSTGYYRDLDTSTTGTGFNGAAKNLKPDHLALLPHSKGACSWQDGCGAPRVNEGDAMDKIIVTHELSLDAQMRKVYDAWYKQVARTTTAEMPSADAPSPYMIREVFADKVLVAGEGDNLAMYPYTVASDGSIAFGDPQKVEVVYKPVTNSRGKNMNENEQQEPIVVNETPEPVDTQAAPQVAPTVNEDLVALTAMVQEFGGAAALREALDGLKVNRDNERAALLGELATNARVTFTPEELASWPTGNLRKLVDALRPADYSGRGGPRANESGSEWQVLAAPEVK
jgi:hypothetical protein